MRDRVVSPEASGARPGARLHYLDWLRVLAVLMVFLFHAVHPFDGVDWQVKNVDQSEILTIIHVILGLWGMPFFFLLAGAASFLALQRRTARQYVSERFHRLLVPFLLWAALFFPLQYYCEVTNKVQRGVQTSFPGLLSLFSMFNLTLLRLSSFTPRWFGLGYHLWFLGFLFSFALVTLPFFLWLKKDSGQRALSWMARLCEHRGGLLLFAIPPAIINCLLTPIFPAVQDWAHFLFLMFFFALGFILFADERLRHAIRRDGVLLLIVGTAIVLVLLGMYLMEFPVMTWGATPGSAEYNGLQFLTSAIAISYSLAVLFAGMRYLNFTSRWLRYGQEASLPFFVLHQPVIVVIAFFVVQWNAAIAVKLPVVVLSSFVVTIGLYELLVRRIRSLRLAFGMKARLPDKA